MEPHPLLMGALVTLHSLLFTTSDNHLQTLRYIIDDIASHRLNGWTESRAVWDGSLINIVIGEMRWDEVFWQRILQVYLFEWITNINMFL